MVSEDEDEFFYAEGNILLTDVDHFISKIKTFMLQETNSDDFRMYIGIDEEAKCFQLWFKDSGDIMYKVRTDMIDDKKIGDLDESQKKDLK